MRQRDEQRSLCHCQPLWLLAKIGQRSRADPFDIAAKRGKPHVKLKDLALRHHAFELPGAEHLADFCDIRMRRTIIEQARGLHCQRRCAGDRAKITHHLPDGTRQSEAVDPAMLIETLILIGQEQLEIAWIDFGFADRKTPEPVRRREGAKKLSVTVENELGANLGSSERRRAEPGERSVIACGHNRGNGEQECCKNPDIAAGFSGPPAFCLCPNPTQSRHVSAGHH